MKPWKAYWSFYCKAGTVYSNQSTLLHNFYEEVIRERHESMEWWKKVHEVYHSDIKNPTSLHRTDFGTRPSRKETISDIVRTQVSTASDLRMWFRLAAHQKADIILELGTSLGWSSAAMSMGNPNGQIMTVEGDPNIVQLARELHRKLQLSNTQIIQSTFENFLKRPHSIRPQLVFIDGNHDYAASIDYVTQCLTFLAPGGMIILHDILWSEGMYKAWNHLIKELPISASLQYENVGFLFTSPSFLDRIDMTWVRWQFKPWQRFFTW